MRDPATPGDHAPEMWLQLRFTCDAETAGPLADLLSECGAL